LIYIESMKTALIFVLLFALGAAAFFTRPSQSDFKQFITDQKTHGDTGVLKTGWDQFQADRFVKNSTFNDRLLWVDVQLNGKTIYTGAFSHWFNRAQVAAELNGVEQKVDSVTK
jgi:hypothetical protein